jgi:nucleotide-binding universal stress UspA family protein
MKSILVQIYDDDGLEARLQAAFDLARAFGAHLTCLHATPYRDYLAADPLVAAELPLEFSAKMERLREALQAKVEERLAAEGMSWDWFHLDEPMDEALIRFSMLSDLIVVGLGRLRLARIAPRPLAGSVALGARAPVLAVADDLERLALDAPILIAWNGSAEAAAAVREALPLLKAAPGVHLVEVEEDESPYPRDLGARYLSRHGIHAEIVPVEDLDGDVGAMIRQAAYHVGAGMIVMGAYGRSRLRETMFGGVTRDMLAESTLPLLLAH